MSGEGGYDLTGEWSGIYSYPRLFPPNMFEASIRDSGGIITGVIRQPGEVFEPTGTHHHAVIEGSRVGSLVRWVKMYDDLSRATPHYEGTIQPDGNEIEGTWHIPNDWSGTFLMIRRGQEEAGETRKVSEEIGAR
ncbi:MAG: hypothetical protein B7Z08_06010 [Sphingomonadales bacterium 32-68-7]|nr:MAG: hypothetical protein B7Z33_11260 [Sphingomonadales bacterium 12-68-11]OYX09292.1 MAG: hypothetical protein B7Z08_06010 [Sphingomonadales bacterium 32-68-7]